jgi:hypothetical protein
LRQLPANGRRSFSPDQVSFLLLTRSGASAQDGDGRGCHFPSCAVRRGVTRLKHLA